MDSEDIDFFDAPSPSVEYISPSRSNSPVSIADSDQRSSTAEPSPQASPMLTPASLPVCGFAQNMATQIPQSSLINQQPWVAPALNYNSMDAAPETGNANESPEERSYRSTKGKEREDTTEQAKAMNEELNWGMRDARDRTQMTLAGQIRSRPHQLRDDPGQLKLLTQEERGAAVMKANPGGLIDLSGVESVAGGAIFDDGANGNSQSAASKQHISQPPWMAQLQQQMQKFPGMAHPLSGSEPDRDTASFSRSQMLEDIRSATNHNGPSMVGQGDSIENHQAAIPPASLSVQPGVSATAQNSPHNSTQQAQNKTSHVLDQHQLALHALEAHGRKRLAEAQLEQLSSQETRNQDINNANCIESISRQSIAESLEERFEKSRRLFAVAHAQLQHQLGMTLTDDEKEIAKLGSYSGIIAEEQFRDIIFIESIKLELLTHQLSTYYEEQGGTRRPSPAENEQTTQRREQRETRDEDPTTLPHKPAFPAPGSQHYVRTQSWTRRASAHVNISGIPPPSASRPPQFKPPNFKPPNFNAVTATPLPPANYGVRQPGPPPSAPTWMRDSRNALPGPPPTWSSQNYTPPGPHPPGLGHPLPARSQNHALPGPTQVVPPPPPPPPPPIQLPVQPLPPPDRPNQSGGRTVGPPPPPTRYPRPPFINPGPRPPPNLPPAMRPSGPPPRPLLKPPTPSPLISTLPAGITVKIFTTKEGQTSTTMTTNPDFKIRDGVEIITKTVNVGGRVETVTTTALVPLMKNEKLSGNGNGRAHKSSGKVIVVEKPDARDIDDSDDSDDSDASMSLGDD